MKDQKGNIQDGKILAMSLRCTRELFWREKSLGHLEGVKDAYHEKSPMGQWLHGLNDQKGLAGQADCRSCFAPFNFDCYQQQARLGSSKRLLNGATSTTARQTAVGIVISKYAVLTRHYK